MCGVAFNDLGVRGPAVLSRDSERGRQTPASQLKVDGAAHPRAACSAPADGSDTTPRGDRAPGQGLPF